MNLLDQLLQEHETKTEEIKNILKRYKGKTLKWSKNDNCFYVLSKSAKENGFQLTYFINQEPVGDCIRNSYINNDFIERLTINNCKLEKVF